MYYISKLEAREIYNLALAHDNIRMERELELAFEDNLKFVYDKIIECANNKMSFYILSKNLLGLSSSNKPEFNNRLLDKVLEHLKGNGYVCESKGQGDFFIKWD